MTNKLQRAQYNGPNISALFVALALVLAPCLAANITKDVVLNDATPVQVVEVQYDAILPIVVTDSMLDTYDALVNPNDSIALNISQDSVEMNNENNSAAANTTQDAVNTAIEMNQEANQANQANSAWNKYWEVQGDVKYLIDATPTSGNIAINSFPPTTITANTLTCATIAYQEQVAMNNNNTLIENNTDTANTDTANTDTTQGAPATKGVCFGAWLVTATLENANTDNCVEPALTKGVCFGTCLAVDVNNGVDTSPSAFISNAVVAGLAGFST